MKSNTLSSLTGSMLVVAVVGALLAFSPTSRAVTPAPDGGYAGHNTAEGENALFSLTTGVNNTAVGFQALYKNTSGSYNKADGASALRNNTTGSLNTGEGAFALFSNTSGSFNTAEGYKALYANTTGKHNTGIGQSALMQNTTGSDNIALGINAGSANTIGNFNIDIGNVGDSTDFNTIHIGTEGTHLAAFIAGISGTVVSGTSVCVSSSGQVGECMPSSERFKHDIAPMEKASEVILSLKPVTFRYNADLDPKEAEQFGLVAEEVQKVAPELVRHDKNGKINGVRYEAVNAMLLNEFLKEHRRVEEQTSRLAEQEKTIKTLTASLKDQAAQIQKVSAELTLMKSKPQLVENAK